MFGRSADEKAMELPPSTDPVATLGGYSAVGQVIRQKEPENFEFIFPTLGSFTTPNEHFYVRSHFPKPTIDAKKWRLKIEGAVEKEVELSLGEIMKLPAEKRMVTLECAGNGRIYLVPKENGAQWELGAVSNAEWTGVRLTDVLALAGIKPGAVEIVLEGADEGKPDEPPRPSSPRAKSFEKRRAPHLRFLVS